MMGPIIRVDMGVSIESGVSIVVYGRNDDHGYNYHKRLAISLNCLAELLSGASDEIIFVDYNSPNELPTIVEAIQDTLTEKTKKRLRTLRVRSCLHARFKTHLPLLEPVARNIAIRRSNPKNKWILSTNIDMIFVPQNPMNLTEIIASLEDGYYSLPRFELPENLWELSLRRLDPVWNIEFLREHSQKLHLDTVIRKEGAIQYDNPGDFQLMLRKDIFEMGGFDEQMLKGWHVDSNISRRMFLAKKSKPSIEKLLKGYHCNHTHKESIQHNQQRTENSWKQFVDSHMIMPIANGSNWGFSGEPIEEISLGSDNHLRSMVKILETFPVKEYEILHNVDLYNCLAYSTPRIFTHLVDHLRHVPKTKNILYFGYNKQLVQMMESYLEINQFSGKIFYGDIAFVDGSISLMIFDFGFDESSKKQPARGALKIIMKNFLKALRHAEKSTKFVGINANYTDYNVLLLKHLSMRLTSYVTGSSYGYLPSKRKNKRSIPTLASIKKRAIFNIRYFLVRYLNRYSDRIHSFARRVKL
jgi:hypothetical protein